MEKSQEAKRFDNNYEKKRLFVLVRELQQLQLLNFNAWNRKEWKKTIKSNCGVHKRRSGIQALTKAVDFVTGNVLILRDY